jgi:hypothetical protein
MSTIANGPIRQIVVSPKDSKPKEAYMKTNLCILALLVLTASTADAGGYAHRSYVTGRPTLFPRYYAGNYGAYRYGLYPYGYYEGTAWGGPVLWWPRYYGW